MISGVEAGKIALHRKINQSFNVTVEDICRIFFRGDRKMKSKSISGKAILMRRLSCLLLLVSLLLTGCSTYQRRKQAIRFPIKIGLLADSQITSHNGFSNYSQRSKLSDSLVDVAIRPPALERCLAEEMLNITLEKLTSDSKGTRKGVDVILYLGDGANSGGADEIETVFSALDNCRQRTQTPIFVVIGNHDYLGCGNLESPGTRFAILNQIGKPDNPALTKYEVLKKISEFNHTSNSMTANKNFQYIDNFETLRRHKQLDHRTGLYLSGRLTYRRDGDQSVEIFLMDSSDYKDAPDWSKTAKLGFYGSIGSVSFRDNSGGMGLSQLGYFKELSQTSSPHFRLVASHYPKNHLDRITFAKPGDVPLNLTDMMWEVTEGAFSIPEFTKSLNFYLNQLLIPSKRNYWLSAHTHVQDIPSPDKIPVGGILGDKYFNSINIGSTTDYKAHGAIVESFRRNSNKSIDGLLGYRQIRLFESNELLQTAILHAIAGYGRDHYNDPDMQSVMNNMPDRIVSDRESDWIAVGASLLGMDKKYQQDYWTEKQSEASEKHLRAFIDKFIKDTGYNRADTVALLGLITGAYEKQKITKKTDLNNTTLNKLTKQKKWNLLKL